MEEQALLDSLKAEFHPPLSPTLITTLLFDHEPSDPLSLAAIKETLAMLASSAKHEQDHDDQVQYEQQLLETHNQQRDEQDEDDEAAVRAALEEWSLSSETTWNTDGTESTDNTSQDDQSIPDDTTGSRKFLQTLFPYLSPNTLQAALDGNPDGDLEQVVEYLLSVETVRESEERGGEYEHDGADAATQWENLTQEERDALWEARDFEEEKEQQDVTRSLSHARDDQDTRHLDAPFQEVPSRTKSKPKKLKPATVKVTLGSLPLTQGHTRSKSTSSTASARSTSKRQPHASGSGSPASYQASASDSPDPWAAFDSLALTLSSLLPHAPPALFSSHLHHPSYPSAHAAILAAITEVASQSSASPGGPNSDMMLEIIFGDENDTERVTYYRKDVELVWRAAEGDLSLALDVWGVLIDVESWAPYAPTTNNSSPSGPAEVAAFKSIWVRKDISKDVLHSHIPGPSPLRSTTASASNSPQPSPQLASKPLPPQHEHNPAESFPTLSHPSLASGPFSITPPSPVRSSSRPSSPPPTQQPIGNAPPRSPFPRRALPQKLHNQKHRWNATGKDAKPRKPNGEAPRLVESIPAYARAAKTKEGKEQRWQDLREKEMLERCLRNEALMMATRYFKSGSVGNQGGSVAAHYAETARKLGDNTRRFGLEAAKAQLRQSNQYTPTYLDLHGLTSYQALSIVREAIHTWWDTRTCTPPSPPYVIVTGVGRHSAGGKAVLAPAVAKMLKDDGWKISKGVPGQITVMGAA